MTLLIPGLLLFHLFACAQTNSASRPPSRYPKTGISSSDLQPAFREFKQFLPTNGVSILVMAFDDSDTARITARVNRKSASGVREFRFLRAGGKWRAGGETEGMPADYAKLGITPEEVEEAIGQIKELLPSSRILLMTLQAAMRIEVTTGRQGGPRYGRGLTMDFQKNNGKWKKTAEGEWVS